MIQDLAADWFPPEHLPPADEVEAYYDPSRRCYWIKNACDGWIEVNEQSLRRRLRESGLTGAKDEDENLSQLEQRILDVQMKHSIAYAGPVAGSKIGITKMCGNLVLVTSEAVLPQPKPGEWATIQAFLKNLFADTQHNQLDFVYGWLKVAWETLNSGASMPGQALALAGPPNCGKSLFQLFVTEMLGGRSAKPYRYMSGQSHFNSDLLGAEHQVIEDEVSTTDIRHRREFG